jgi:serine/threonine-protein kinase
VTTEPPGARVTIDGEARGVSPVTVGELAAGHHKISVAGAGGVSADRIVTTEAGVTTSVVFSLPKAPTLTAGWLTITAPFEVRVVEGSEVIGTSAAAKIMIPAGSHELGLVNPSLGYESHRKVVIEPGQTATVRVDASAPLNANARPWAEVVIDGAPVGVTPIANFVLPLGYHQVIFRHPTLGERREDVVVTLLGPNRVSIDMTK